ncbi:MAG: hypothetical protein V3V00_15635 [Saprospiraceae bacterium]
MITYLAIFLRATDRACQQLQLSTITNEIEYRNKDCFIFLINQEWKDYLSNLFKTHEICFKLDDLKTMMAEKDYNNEDFLNLDETLDVLDCTEQPLAMLTDHITSVLRPEIEVEV